MLSEARVLEAKVARPAEEEELEAYSGAGVAEMPCCGTGLDPEGSAAEDIVLFEALVLEVNVARPAEEEEFGEIDEEARKSEDEDEECDPVEIEILEAFGNRTDFDTDEGGVSDDNSGEKKEDSEEEEEEEEGETVAQSADCHALLQVDGECEGAESDASADDGVGAAADRWKESLLCAVRGEEFTANTCSRLARLMSAGREDELSDRLAAYGAQLFQCSNGDECDFGPCRRRDIAMVDDYACMIEAALEAKQFGAKAVDLAALPWIGSKEEIAAAAAAFWAEDEEHRLAWEEARATKGAVSQRPSKKQRQKLRRLAT